MLLGRFLRGNCLILPRRARITVPLDSSGLHARQLPPCTVLTAGSSDDKPRQKDHADQRHIARRAHARNTFPFSNPAEQPAPHLSIPARRLAISAAPRRCTATALDPTVPTRRRAATRRTMSGWGNYRRALPRSRQAAAGALPNRLVRSRTAYRIRQHPPLASLFFSALATRRMPRGDPFPGSAKERNVPARAQLKGRAANERCSGHELG